MINQNHSIKHIIFLAIYLVSFLNMSSAYSQDLEARRWNILPLGTQVLGGGYAYTKGDVLLDPTLKIEDASIKASTFVLQYVRPFKLGNKFARVDVLLPIRLAHWEGLLDGNFTTVDRNGFMDSRIRLSVNLIGPNASGPKELFQYFKENAINTTVGASISVTLPTGLYHPDKLLNIAQNRFTIRPQIGVLHNRGKWSFELTSSVFFFTNNNNFFGGNTRTQKPMFAIQSHIIKRFESKLWASASVGTGTGSKSTINNVSKNDRRQDILASLTVGYPLAKKQSLKLAYVYSRTTRIIGSNTDTLVLGWALLL